MLTDNQPDGETLVEIFRRASLIKINDEQARKVISSGRLVMPYYSPRGQEIIPSTLSIFLNDDDYLSTIYRGTHDMIAKGFPLDLLWAEMAGRVDGTCQGKGGCMHLTYPAKGCMITTGIVGSSMPVALGLGWSAQLQGRGQVAVACFGDGASNIGAFHESLNMASLWKLPVIFVCQNNQFAEHTSLARGTAGPSIAARAAGYGMVGEQVDGNDVFAMHAAASAAVARARAGEGPTLIEAMTFRFFGHVFGDDDSYMDKERKKAAMAADPVKLLREMLIEKGYADEAALAAIEAKAESDVEAAIVFALNSPFPEISDLENHVYAEAMA